MWFKLTGDARIDRPCASEGCGGQPTWRLEAGGIGSDYCPGCKHKIDGLKDLARLGQEYDAAEDFK